jgi:hypothetical protein
MSFLFDDVSRVIGSSVSRRKMLGMVGGAVGGAMLASLGLRSTAFATVHCEKGDTVCGKNCCPPSKVCMNGICCPPSDTNCGGSCCPGTCYGSLCCGKGATLCGGKCCAPGLVCCNGKCCSYPGAICFNGKCCDSAIVCNGVCCTTNQICCKGKCVDKHESPIRC